MGVMHILSILKVISTSETLHKCMYEGTDFFLQKNK
jgi:hypothetical protein